MLIWKRSDGEGPWICGLVLCGSTISPCFDYDNVIDDTAPPPTCFIITVCFNRGAALGFDCTGATWQQLFPVHFAFVFAERLICRKPNLHPKALKSPVG